MEIKSPSAFPAQSRQCPEDSMFALYSGWNYEINLFGIYMVVESVVFSLSLALSPVPGEDYMQYF